jgi:AcrR family transcriptional regulator
MRSDTQRNRRQLVKAAGQLFAARRGPINMSDIAKHAEISTATAYRHFPSVEDVLAEYRFGVGEKLRDFSLKQESTGLELLEAVSRKWVDLVTRHGGAMLYTRSGEGYLARLRKGAYYLTVQADALGAAAAGGLRRARPGTARRRGHVPVEHPVRPPRDP